jgi:hypothetical protein
MAHQIDLSEHAERIIGAAAVMCGMTDDQYIERFIECWAAQLAEGAQDQDQAWYWTPEWQAGERAADVDLAAGRSTRFESDEAFLQALEAHLDDETEAGGGGRQ